MEYTNYFASMNKMIGAFPGMKSEAFSTIMNIVSVESKISLLRELKPDDTTSAWFGVCNETEHKLRFQLNSLTKGKRPEVLLVDLITRWFEIFPPMYQKQRECVIGVI